MTVTAVPEGYHSIQPYLILSGATRAIEFYKKAFGANERLRMEKGNRVSHAEIRIGDSVIMLADEHPEINAFGPSHFGGSPVSLLIYTSDCDAMYKQAIAAGAKSEREPKDQPYGDRMAGIVDPFGYRWYLSTHIQDVSKDELEAQNF